MNTRHTVSPPGDDSPGGQSPADLKHGWAWRMAVGETLVVLGLRPGEYLPYARLDFSPVAVAQAAKLMHHPCLSQGGKEHSDRRGKLKPDGNPVL